MLDCWPIAIWALEFPFLIKHHLKLFLERHASKERVDGLATSDTVFVLVATTVCSSNKMLYARFSPRELLFAEKAEAALNEHQAIKRFGGHTRQDFIGKIQFVL